jgi:NADPH-dependent 2,4-dienoyl-CoA reductase/sulfur reductase-like enzyme
VTGSDRAAASILVVGASVAGVRAVQALRAGGYDGHVTLAGDEPHHPYDRPPLSKEMLAAAGDGAPVPLLSAEEMDKLDVDLRRGLRAASLDPLAHAVRAEDGQTLFYDELVIATGLMPRTLPCGSVRGVHTIRTADDAAAVRAALARTPRVVVVGAGFIGAELASMAREYGCPVTVVEVQPVPMTQLLGPEVGQLLADLHAEHGVRLQTGVSVAGLESDAGTVSGVLLSDGQVLPAELVIVGIGARPATGWLASSGLPVSDGIDCDEHLRVLGVPHIHAAGDVARWPHPLYGEPLRIEHWTNANEHAAIVAADILGLPAPRAQLPYVWSDQYGHRIQIVGRPATGSVAAVQGTATDGQLVALYAGPDGRLVGAVVMDDARTFMKARKAVAARAAACSVELPLRRSAPG